MAFSLSFVFDHRRATNMGDHDDHDDTAYLLKSGRVHLSLEELSNLLRSVQKPTNAPKSGSRLDPLI